VLSKLKIHRKAGVFPYLLKMLSDIRKLERIKDLGSEDSSGLIIEDDEQEPWGEVNLVRDNILQRHADALVSEIGKRTRSPKVNNDTGGDYVVEVYDPLSANKDTTELSPKRSFELRGIRNSNN
jgi:hypothetical protein